MTDKCDLQLVRARDALWGCGNHSVWFHDNREPDLCPVGKIAAKWRALREVLTIDLSHRERARDGARYEREADIADGESQALRTALNMMACLEANGGEP